MEGRKERGRKKNIKWPKANESEVWKKLDSDLTLILQNSLKGQVENKVSSEIIYEECLDRFGHYGKKKDATSKAMSRREKEILQLVKDRRALHKAWKKAEEHQKEGLKTLLNEVRNQLSSHLRRA